MENNSKLKIDIKKKFPKENAITYDLRTIKEIYDIINKDNIDNFLKDFELILRSIAFFKEIDGTVEFDSLTWTDD